MLYYILLSELNDPIPWVTGVLKVTKPPCKGREKKRTKKQKFPGSSFAAKCSSFFPFRPDVSLFSNLSAAASLHLALYSQILSLASGSARQHCPPLHNLPHSFDSLVENLALSLQVSSPTKLWPSFTLDSTLRQTLISSTARPHTASKGTKYLARLRSNILIPKAGGRRIQAQQRHLTCSRSVAL